MNKKLIQTSKMLFLVFCFLFIVGSINAKTGIVPFRIDLGIGYASMRQYVGYGLSYYIEPKYAILPQLSLGTKADLTSIMFSTPQDVYKIYSCFFTTDYYFTQNVFRSFVGTGIGICNMYSNGFFATQYISEYKLGWMLRAGFDVNHFRFQLGYDFVGRNIYGNTANLFRIAIGAYLWGGKSKNKA